MNLQLIEQAKQFAKIAHDRQFRKYGIRPYIYHPAKVAEYLFSNGFDDENLLCATWLHDTVEDCPNVTYNILEEKFGLAGKYLGRLFKRKCSVMRNGNYI